MFLEWLGRFPATNALILSGICLAWATFIASLFGWKIPENWLMFVGSYAGVAAAQFSAKRLTYKPPQDGDSA